MQGSLGIRLDTGDAPSGLAASARRATHARDSQSASAPTNWSAASIWQRADDHHCEDRFEGQAAVSGANNRPIGFAVGPCGQRTRLNTCAVPVMYRQAAQKVRQGGGSPPRFSLASRAVRHSLASMHEPPPHSPFPRSVSPSLAHVPALGGAGGHSGIRGLPTLAPLAARACSSPPPNSEGGFGRRGGGWGLASTTSPGFSA